MSQPSQPRVVIVGGGFGGLYTAQALRKAPAAVTLIDRRNFHLFQPLLYQVATGGLSPEDIASPLRGVLKRQKNTRVLTGKVADLDPARGVVRLEDGAEIGYDTLVIATGAHHHYFGRDDEWSALAPGLKTIEDAITIRRRVLLAFEAAEREPDPDRRRALLTFVIVGGGPGKEVHLVVQPDAPRAWLGRWAIWPATPCPASSAASTRPRRRFSSSKGWIAS